MFDLITVMLLLAVISLIARQYLAFKYRGLRDDMKIIRIKLAVPPDKIRRLGSSLPFGAGSPAGIVRSVVVANYQPSSECLDYLDTSYPNGLGSKYIGETI